jgi:hypothetical protein
LPDRHPRRALLDLLPLTLVALAAQIALLLRRHLGPVTRKL